MSKLQSANMQEKISEREYIIRFFSNPIPEKMRVVLKGIDILFKKEIVGAEVKISVVPFDFRKPIKPHMWGEIFSFMEAFGYKIHGGVMQDRIVRAASDYESPKQKLLKQLRNLGDKNLDVNI